MVHPVQGQLHADHGREEAATDFFIGILQLGSGGLLVIFIVSYFHWTASPGRSAVVSTRPTVVFEIWCDLAIWLRLRPRSRSRTTAARSITRGLRPMWRPSSLARRIPARTR